MFLSVCETWKQSNILIWWGKKKEIQLFWELFLKNLVRFLSVFMGPKWGKKKSLNNKIKKEV